MMYESYEKNGHGKSLVKIKQFDCVIFTISGDDYNREIAYHLRNSYGNVYSIEVISQITIENKNQLNIVISNLKNIAKLFELDSNGLKFDDVSKVLDLLYDLIQADILNKVLIDTNSNEFKQLCHNKGV